MNVLHCCVLIEHIKLQYDRELPGTTKACQRPVNEPACNVRETHVKDSLPEAEASPHVAQRKGELLFSKLPA
jgi:hypothetical protein